MLQMPLGLLPSYETGTGFEHRGNPNIRSPEFKLFTTIVLKPKKKKVE